MKNKHFIIVFAASMTLLFGSCSESFLDTTSMSILTEDQVFGDEVLIKAALANFYGRMDWGERPSDSGQYLVVDDALKCDGGPDTRSTIGTDQWRIYDYTLVRNLNLYLDGVRNTSALTQASKTLLEGETRFIRAWYYFISCRGLGGVPIVHDDIYNYTAGMDITTIQNARATEAETYDYIISECQAAYSMLSGDKNANNARANKWTAKLLEARAALYAASIANYNNKLTTPITTPGGEVGIPASLAQSYYQKALAAAEDVINNSPYVLQQASENTYTALAKNFYNATTVKSANTEVMWCRDYKSPSVLHAFTTSNAPHSHAEDLDNSYLGGIVNLAEQFEPINTSTPGKMEPFVTQENGDYKFYNTAAEIFEARDPRLWATYIYPGAMFKGKEVVMQAGQLIKENGAWTTRVVAGTGIDQYDDDGRLIVAENGPRQSNEQLVNKTGFYVRKWLDETVGNGTRGHGSDVWAVRMRIAEAYMIACEAAFELGDNAKATTYINAIRTRAGVKPLTSVTFDNIVHECRVEFALEDHRYWDMKRWRLAHTVWNGNSNDGFARPRSLWPYRVKAPGDPNDGKWVFIESLSFMRPNATYFQMLNYYNYISLTWQNNNPKIVLNPYQ